MVFSPPYRKIVYCDSIKTYCPARDLKRKDSILLLAYLFFPYIITSDWTFDKIYDDDSFQNADDHHDCGFHILNFAMSAINDVEIETNDVEFAKFKRDTAKKYCIPVEILADS